MAFTSTQQAPSGVDMSAQNDKQQQPGICIYEQNLRRNYTSLELAAFSFIGPNKATGLYLPCYYNSPM